MRSAVLDLGSNTFHALVADVDAFGVREVLAERKLAVRIGEHAFAPQHIAEAAYARGLDAIGQLLAQLPERTRVIATGVFRDADNGRDLLAEASARHGVAIELLGGHDEARLTWLGVSSELAGSHGCLAVVDLGGGSLELAAGEEGVAFADSMPLGVLRLRHVAPPEIRAAVAAEAAQAITELRASRPDTVALASGTARALLALARRLGLVAGVQRHVGARTFGELARKLTPLSHDAIQALGVAPSRRDTIAAGAIALATVLELLDRPVVYIARSALREGALIELARRAALPAPPAKLLAYAGAR